MISYELGSLPTPFYHGALSLAHGSVSDTDAPSSKSRTREGPGDYLLTTAFSWNILGTWYRSFLSTVFHGNKGRRLSVARGLSSSWIVGLL